MTDAKSEFYENALQKLIYQAVDIALLADDAVTTPITEIAVALHTADPLDAGAGVGAVRYQTELGGGKADRFVSGSMDGHSHQRNRHLLTGCQEHVQLPLVRVMADGVRQGQQFIGGSSHG